MPEPAEVIRAPRCPGCDNLPQIALSGQYFCGNDDCNVWCWDPMDDPATFKAKAKVINLGFLDP